MEATRTARDPQVELARLRALVRVLTERNAQLETALESRIVIEQAKGMLAERLRMTPDEAFSVLRRAARSNRVKLHALAGAVVTSRERSLEIYGLLDGGADGTPPAAA